MKRRIRVIQYGLGPIGCAIARHITERKGLALVGAVDVGIAVNAIYRVRAAGPGLVTMRDLPIVTA